jgi:hypothetical protein|tara:strand:+ start:145 stop:390 length:246 start_codon:yes stop_codon:yes gene_type:complete
MKTEISTYDIACLALKSAPRYALNTGGVDGDLLTNDLCSRFGLTGTDDRMTVNNIVRLALDAATSGDFRNKAEFILTQVEK